MNVATTGPLVLAVESSCDETGVALVEGGSRIRSNVVASQVALHAPAGGIVPEVAARAHLRWILPVLDEAWRDVGASWADVGAVAVTRGPGLAGSLLVGINVAKTLAWVHDKPLVGVNHLEGHVYAAWLRDAGQADGPEPVFPLVALVVSGGHTFLVEMTDHPTYRLPGQTVDHSPGAAFDKEFLAHEVAYHKAVIDAVTTQFLPAIKNAELKSFVEKVAPAFDAHMRAADALLKKQK